MGNLDLTSYLDTTEDESMYIDSDVPSTSAKPTQGRKRKNSETATKERKVTGRAHAKRARGNGGILKIEKFLSTGILSVPPRLSKMYRLLMDIFYQFVPQELGTGLMLIYLLTLPVPHCFACNISRLHLWIHMRLVRNSMKQSSKDAR